MANPRVPITEWNLGEFPDSMEFQSWKLNFKTEICIRTAEPQGTMLWIKEVEAAKSIDELVTSRSITGQTNFPDFDLLDVIIASALKKLINTQSTFTKKSTCRRATGSKFRPILTRKTNCVLDLRVFPCNWSVWNSTQDSQICSLWLCKSDDVQNFDVRWDHAPYQSVRRFQTRSWKDCTGPNDRIPLSFKLWWPCMIKDLFEIMEHRSINNWRLQWNFILIRWWEIRISKSGTMLWKGVQSPRVKKETKTMLRGKWESVSSAHKYCPHQLDPHPDLQRLLHPWEEAAQKTLYTRSLEWDVWPNGQPSSDHNMSGIPEDQRFEDLELAYMLENPQKGKKGSGKSHQKGEKGSGKGEFRDKEGQSSRKLQTDPTKATEWPPQQDLEGPAGWRDEKGPWSDTASPGWRRLCPHPLLQVWELGHLAKDCPQNKEDVASLSLQWRQELGRGLRDCGMVCDDNSAEADFGEDDASSKGKSETVPLSSSSLGSVADTQELQHQTWSRNPSLRSSTHRSNRLWTLPTPSVRWKLTSPMVPPSVQRSKSETASSNRRFDSSVAIVLCCLFVSDLSGHHVWWTRPWWLYCETPRPPTPTMATPPTPLNPRVRGGDEAPCRSSADLRPRWHADGHGMFFVNREKGLFLSVYVDDIKLAGKKQKHQSDLENSHERRWFGRTNIIPGQCLFGLHSKRMSDKQGFLATEKLSESKAAGKPDAEPVLRAELAR